jgi:metal-sulfur cluster biosynthetic enzyme
MGLIYDVAWDDATLAADVTMTLTTPHCPAGPMIVEGVRRRLERVDGVGDVRVHVTFDPPWTPERITPAGRRELGWA